MLRRAVLSTLAFMALGLAAGPAAAQDVVTPADSATGWDHESDPPPGTFSSADWCFSFTDPALVGETITVEATGPNGTVSGTGEVEEDGRVKVRVGITEGGTYTVTSITASPSGRAVSADDVAGIEVAFDPTFVDCLGRLVTSPTPSTEAPGTQPPPSEAPPASEPTSTAAPTTTPASAPEPASGSDTGSSLPLVLVVVGLLLLFIGAAISSFPAIGAAATTTRCARERREVERLTRELQAAEAEEKRKRALADDLQKQVEGIRFKRTNNPQKREIDERALMRKQRDAESDVGIAAAFTRTVRESLTKAQAALDACIERTTAPHPSAPGTTTGGGTAPPASDTKNKHPDCCPSGNWIGLNVYTGGIIFGGVESGVITLWCVEDPSRMAVLKWTGTRIGFAIGGEASAGLFLVVGGGVHPYELPKTVAGILKGIDADLTVGVSWSKLLKGMGKAGRSLDKWKKLKKSVESARDATKAVKKAKGAGKTVEAARIGRAHADTFEELIREGGADAIAEATIKSAASGVQAGGTGVNIPYGKGLQAGFWYLFEPKVVLLDLDGCKNCDPSKS